MATAARAVSPSAEGGAGATGYGRGGSPARMAFSPTGVPVDADFRAQQGEDGRDRAESVVSALPRVSDFHQRRPGGAPSHIDMNLARSGSMSLDSRRFSVGFGGGNIPPNTLPIEITWWHAFGICVKSGISETTQGLARFQKLAKDLSTVVYKAGGAEKHYICRAIADMNSSALRTASFAKFLFTAVKFGDAVFPNLVTFDKTKKKSVKIENVAKEGFDLCRDFINLLGFLNAIKLIQLAVRVQSVFTPLSLGLAAVVDGLDTCITYNSWKRHSRERENVQPAQNGIETMGERWSREVENVDLFGYRRKLVSFVVDILGLVGLLITSATIGFYVSQLLLGVTILTTTCAVITACYEGLSQPALFKAKAGGKAVDDFCNRPIGESQGLPYNGVLPTPTSEMGERVFSMQELAGNDRPHLDEDLQQIRQAQRTMDGRINQVIEMVRGIALSLNASRPVLAT
jgi:hypothetical protein